MPDSCHLTARVLDWWKTAVLLNNCSDVEHIPSRLVSEEGEVSKGQCFCFAPRDPDSRFAADPIQDLRQGKKSGL